MTLDRYDVAVADDDRLLAVRDTGDALVLHMGGADDAPYEVVPEKLYEAAAERATDAGFDAGQDGAQFTVRSDEPYMVPGTERWAGLVQDGERYALTVTPAGGRSHAVTVQHPELLQYDDCFAVTRDVVDALYDVSLSRP